MPLLQQFRDWVASIFEPWQEPASGDVPLPTPEESATIPDWVHEHFNLKEHQSITDQQSGHLEDDKYGLLYLDQQRPIDFGGDFDAEAERKQLESYLSKYYYPAGVWEEGLSPNVMAAPADALRVTEDPAATLNQSQEAIASQPTKAIDGKPPEQQEPLPEQRRIPSRSR